MKRISFNIFSKYREVLMGMAILSVLIFHYTDDCYAFGINYSGIVKYYRVYIGSSGVDIFLLLSGLGLYYSFSKNSNIKDFYCKRFKRILIPYFMIAIPIYIWYDFVYLSDGIIGFIKNLFFITLFTSGNVLFWYIFFIIVCYLLFPLIYKFIYKSSDSVSLIKILGIVLTLIVIILFIGKYYPTIFTKYNIMLLRSIPFVLGILIGKFSYKNKKIGYYIIPIVLCLLSPLLINRFPIFKRLFIFAFNFSIMFLIIVMFDYFINKKSNIIKSLSFFGKYSLEIYLVHVAIRKILLTNNCPDYKVFYYLLFAIVSIVASVMFNKMVNSVIKNRERR